MQIEIDEAIIDQIMKTELRESIDCLKMDIKKLKKNKSRLKYEDEDLKHDEQILPHLEAVYNYFTGQTL